MSTPRLLAIVIAASIAAACSGDAPAAAPDSAPTAARDLEPAEVAAPRSTDDSDDEVTELRDQVEQLEGELADALEDRDRYRQGLEKAVVKLNQCSGDAAAAAEEALYEEPAAPVRQASSSTAKARISLLHAPTVRIDAGDQALVEARIWNGGDGNASLAVHVELLVDNRTVDSSNLTVDIQAGGDVAIAERFTIDASQDGVYSARISWDVER